MSGEWTGGHTGVGRRWHRQGRRGGSLDDTPELRARLWDETRHQPFWCDNCGGLHPLIEHQICRAEFPYRSAYRGAT